MPVREFLKDKTEVTSWSDRRLLMRAVDATIDLSYQVGQLAAAQARTEGDVREIARRVAVLEEGRMREKLPSLHDLAEEIVEEIRTNPGVEPKAGRNQDSDRVQALVNEGIARDRDRVDAQALRDQRAFRNKIYVAAGGGGRHRVGHDRAGRARGGVAHRPGARRGLHRGQVAGARDDPRADAQPRADDAGPVAAPHARIRRASHASPSVGGSLMLVQVSVPGIACIVGLLAYVMASKPETKEMGRIAFFVGLLWLIYVFATRTVHLP
jgi:hypothetical protein